jgi:hypothetical protein
MPSYPAHTPAAAAVVSFLGLRLWCVFRWSNARSEGKLMSFDLVDKDGGEIKATAWNEQVDMFNDIIQVCGVGGEGGGAVRGRRPVNGGGGRGGGE